MKISHNDLAYKLAWRWRPWIKEMPIRQIDLCSLARAIAHTVFLSWPLAAVWIPTLAVFCGVVITVGFVIGFAVGNYLSFRQDDMDFAPIPILTKWKPIYFAIAGAIIWWAYFCYKVVDYLGLGALINLGRKAKVGGKDDLLAGVGMTIAILFVLTAVGSLTYALLAIGRWYRRGILPEMGHGISDLFRVWLKSFKDKTCPIVKID